MVPTKLGIAIVGYKADRSEKLFQDLRVYGSIIVRRSDINPTRMKTIASSFKNIYWNKPMIEFVTKSQLKQLFQTRVFLSFSEQIKLFY